MLSFVGLHLHHGLVDRGVDDDPRAAAQLAARRDVHEDGLARVRVRVRRVRGSRVRGSRVRVRDWVRDGARVRDWVRGWGVRRTCL